MSSHPSQQHTLPCAGLVQIPYANPCRPVSGDDATQAVFDQLDFLFDCGCPPDDIGALFIEPLQSDGGMIVPPSGFLNELSERCRKHGILIVSDEVKVGLGRPGRWHCYQAESFTPDVVTFGKGLGSGAPISAIAAPRAVMDFQEAFALITTTGNAVSTMVAHAVPDTIERDGLIANAEARGRQIMDGLRALQADYPLIGDVRGRGLAIGFEFELARASATKEPATVEADKVVLRGDQPGTAFTCAGMFSNVPEITPPLTLSEAEADEAVSIIGQAIDDVENGRMSDDEVAAFAGW